MSLSTSDIRLALPQWEIDDEKQIISRTFVFVDFVQAFEFMKHCAQYANEIDHHPDWSNSWNKVVVHLSTHSASKTILILTNIQLLGKDILFKALCRSLNTPS